ncbi:MAG: biotin-dependent carboxyltransferase family protein [Gemmatimonadaceae bacterium]|nr:biotin-dependent carboxyltransferase family protein [Gemmatimonadaceae bacterium]
MIKVVRAPAHLAVQDAGFSGQRRIGLPRAGAMDLSALALGNMLVGNVPGEAALEWAVNGGTLRFDRSVTVALTGARPRGRVGNRMLQLNTALEIPAGTVLEIDRIVSGRFLYISLSPSLDLDAVLGSRSTYAPARIGGFEGRRLRTGDQLPLQAPAAKNSGRAPAIPNYAASIIRVMRAPQSGVLGGRLLSHLLKNSFTISAASDRMGYRLEGPAADVTGLLQILSEPACEGAIQITDSGTPIVLMADGPTIGGYNKIAVTVPADLPILAQKNPGEAVRFTLI